MIRDITVQELRNLAKPVLIDVRSESEYREATIPGAVNLPLLNDGERAEVGEIYVQVSPALARHQGLRLISPKLPALVEEVEKLSIQGTPVLFCWRGGMRSKAMATVLDLMGVTVYRLQGGYKAYRREILEYFERTLPFQIVVFRGNTGVGKTELLLKLRQLGYPAIDLEGLANNRGSVFGDVGLGPPPSQKAFEAALYEECRRYERYGYVIVECESKRIGRVTLPDKFHRAMQEGIQVLVFDTLANRVRRLVKEYMAHPDSMAQIENALERLVKTLGHEKVRELKELLAARRLEEFTEHLLLDYYDRLYAYPNEPSPDYAFCLSQAKPEQAERELARFLDEQVANTNEQSSLSGV